MENNSNIYDVIIIGAGPAGLFCAFNCAKAGLSVCVLEKNPTAGKKLLIAGSGRCNITNSTDMASFIARYGGRARFVKPVLYAFTNRDLADFFVSKNLNLYETDEGKVFPEQGGSSAVLSILLDECRSNGVLIEFSCEAGEIEISGGGFKIRAGGRIFSARACVIAAGGRSYPATGSTGGAYALASALGHTIVEPAPALAPVYVKDYGFSSCAGISLKDAPASVRRGGTIIQKFSGDILFTHRGLSGPGILDNSRYMRAGDVIEVSFTGGMNPDALEKEIVKRIQVSGKKTVKNFFCGFDIPAGIVLRVLDTAGLPPESPASQLDRIKRARIAGLLAAHPFEAERIGGFDEAMATAGGVALNEINMKTLESRLVPGLYFAGEVVDVDGDTGGFNLQFAFSSGFLAAEAVAGRLNK